MGITLKTLTDYFLSSAPALAEEDRVLSREQLNCIRLMSKRSDHDDDTLLALKGFFNEAVIKDGNEKYTQIKEKMIRQLNANQRIPEEIVRDFKSKTVTERLRCEQ